jgi:hypothetical protein
MLALARAAGVDARVTGAFTMRARVTTAVNVLGEHVGQRLTRRWVIAARGCNGSVCETLELRRQRGDNRHSKITLHRTGPGRYTGRGVFYAALSCYGKVYPHGSRVPYRITLTVAATTEVGGVTFARRITAWYDNRSRANGTRCPLGPSHDAARYGGRLTTPLPAAPVASFSVSIDGATDVASFIDLSYQLTHGAGLVSQLWNFGDSASGAADGSTLANPEHQYSAPGTYVVMLTETDANGLASTTTEIVTAPGPPSAVFRYAQVGDEVTFEHESGPGIGELPFVARYRYFDYRTWMPPTPRWRSITQGFSGRGSSFVTLVVIDANRRYANSSETLSDSG